MLSTDTDTDTDTEYDTDKSDTDCETFKAHPRTLRHARGVKEVKDSAESFYN